MSEELKNTNVTPEVVEETMEEVVGEVVEGVTAPEEEVALAEESSSVPALKATSEVVPVGSAETAEDVMAQIEKSTADADVKVETLCRWAAARAGVIVVAPLLGTVALMANEVYLVSRIAKVYDKKLGDAAIGAFLGAIGGTVAGNLLATLIPLSIVQVPIAVGITYAIGKVAQAWIKDGMPKDMSPYVALLQEWREKATSEAKVMAENPLKNIPLGDESKEQIKSTGEKLKVLMADMKEKVGEALELSKDKAQEKAQALKEKAQAAAVDMAGKIEEKAGNAKEKFASKPGDTLSETVEEVKEKVEDFVEEAVETVDKVAEEVVEKAEEVSEKAASKVEGK